MKLIKKIAVILTVVGQMAWAAPVFAATPYLSVNNQGSGGLFQLQITNADPYANITLYRRQGTTLWTVITNFGMTDASGAFNQAMSLGSDGSNNSVDQYVVVNGWQSNTVSTYPWGYGGGCTYNCGNPYGLSLSQNNLSLSIGQSQTVTITTGYNSGYYGNFYISGNSNSNVASANISGNQLNVYAQNSGSTTITVCQSSASCASLYVTVNQIVGGITFSPSSPSVSVGQSVTVTVSVPYFYSGFYVNSNSNPSVASASISGSSLYINGLSQGLATLNVCVSGSGGACGSLYVTVTGGTCYAGSGYCGNLSLSQTSLSLTVGQNSTVSAYNVSSAYISSNSNPSVASAYANGTQITVNALMAGNTNIYVCGQSSSQCAYVYVTVTGGSSSGSIWFSPSSPSLNVGQSLAVSINSAAYASSYYNSSAYYISSNSNPNVASASLSNTVLNLYANQTGSTNITVCHSSLGYCGNLYVNVTGTNYGGSLYFLTASLPNMAVGQYYSQQLQVAGGSAPYSYYISGGSLPAGVTMSNSGQIYGTPQGYASSSFTVRVSDNYGRSVSQNFTISTSGGGAVLGSSTYSNGQIISVNGTVYIIYKNTQTAFGNAAAYLGLGYNWEQVMQVSYSGIPDSGYIVSTSKTSHPWGSWIKSGSTVYFVHELGLIPVPDYSTFNNNGGYDRLVVKANAWDFQRPMLSVMVWNDTRLK